MGFTQIGFAKLLGITDRTVRRWLSGETAIPKWVDLIINSK
jgi:transcriptional regulator with XRE-family HTH domain